MPKIDIQPTPNPNSLKISLRGRSLTDAGMHAFGSPGEAETHPLGRALFEISGVANVFLTPQFMTVTKRPEADWNAILPDVERILGEQFP